MGMSNQAKYTLSFLLPATNPNETYGELVCEKKWIFTAELDMDYQLLVLSASSCCCSYDN